MPPGQNSQRAYEGETEPNTPIESIPPSPLAPLSPSRAEGDQAGGVDEMIGRLVSSPSIASSLAPPSVSRQAGFDEAYEHEDVPGNLEHHLRNQGKFWPYDEDTPPLSRNETQDIALGEVAAHFSPPRGNLSGPSSSEVNSMDGLVLMPQFNRIVVDALN